MDLANIWLQVLVKSDIIQKGKFRVNVYIHVFIFFFLALFLIRDQNTAQWLIIQVKKVLKKKISKQTLYNSSYCLLQIYSDNVQIVKAVIKIHVDMWQLSLYTLPVLVQLMFNVSCFFGIQSMQALTSATEFRGLVIGHWSSSCCGFSSSSSILGASKKFIFFLFIKKKGPDHHFSFPNTYLLKM